MAVADTMPAQAKVDPYSLRDGSLPPASERALSPGSQISPNSAAAQTESDDACGPVVKRLRLDPYGEEDPCATAELEGECRDLQKALEDAAAGCNASRDAMVKARVKTRMQALLLTSDFSQAGVLDIAAQDLAGTCQQFAADTIAVREKLGREADSEKMPPLLVALAQVCSRLQHVRSKGAEFQAQLDEEKALAKDLQIKLDEAEGLKKARLEEQIRTAERAARLAESARAEAEAAALADAAAKERSAAEAVEADAQAAKARAAELEARVSELQEHARRQHEQVVELQAVEAEAQAAKARAAELEARVAELQEHGRRQHEEVAELEGKLASALAESKVASSPEAATAKAAVGEAPQTKADDVGAAPAHTSADMGAHVEADAGSKPDAAGVEQTAKPALTSLTVAGTSDYLLKRAAKRLVVISEANLGIAGDYRLLNASGQGRPAYRATTAGRAPFLQWTPQDGGHWVFSLEPPAAKFGAPPPKPLARSLQLSWTTLPEELMGRSWTGSPWGELGSRASIAIIKA